MKRRDFITGLSALTTAPMAPAKLLASTLGTTPTSALYLKAAKWAEICEFSSAHSLKYQFGLDDDTADGLFDKLVANHVVAAPDAGGVSRVLLSSYKNPIAVKKALVFNEQGSTNGSLKKVSDGVAKINNDEVETNAISDEDQVDCYAVCEDFELECKAKSDTANEPEA